MAFSIGQIVRPKLQYARKDGTLQDWTGHRSAQGLVTNSGAGVGVPSASYWDPQSSSSTTAARTDMFYTVTVWDLDTLAFIAGGIYAEAELDAGTVNVGSPITAIFATTALTPGTVDQKCANLVRSRS